MKPMQPELKDIFEMLSRYVSINKNVAVIFHAVSFDKDKCEGCGTHDAEIVKDHTVGIYVRGEQENLRMISNMTRDIIEDFSEYDEKEDGVFVDHTYNSDLEGEEEIEDEQ